METLISVEDSFKAKNKEKRHFINRKGQGARRICQSQTPTHLMAVLQDVRPSR